MAKAVLVDTPGVWRGGSGNVSQCVICMYVYVAGMMHRATLTQASSVRACTCTCMYMCTHVEIKTEQWFLGDHFCAGQPLVRCLAVASLFGLLVA